MSETLYQFEILVEAFKEIANAAVNRGFALCSLDEEREKFLGACEKDTKNFFAEGFKRVSSKK